MKTYMYIDVRKLLYCWMCIVQSDNVVIFQPLAMMSLLGRMLPEA